MWLPTTSELHHIRHDLQFLKIASDLKDQSNDKAMRRERNRLLKKEEEREKKKRSEEIEAAAALEKAATGSREGLPSLYAAVSLLSNDFVWKLPREKCCRCNSMLLTSKPSSLESVVSSRRPKTDVKSLLLLDSSFAKEDSSPERLGCGHWYHYGCLMEQLSEPPFDQKTCSKCGATLSHGKVNTKLLAKLQKDWENKQQAERELADVIDFLS